jgi:glycogen debranching enzyme
MSESTDLVAAAKGVLTGNDRGLYTIPAKGMYPHQWLWDSCFIAIGIRHYDVERAKIEILSLLRGQWTNGMVPHMIFTPGLKQHPYLGVWRSWVSPYAPDHVSTSGITQPPLLAEAVVQIGKKLPLIERRSWYRQVYPGLLAYHQWLYAERDPHDEGLVLQIHPWETGLDNTPPWMAEMNEHLLPWWIRALQATKLDGTLGLFRRDTRMVDASQRPTNIEAMAMYDIQRRLRRKEYNITKILDHSLFAIEDLAFNSILIRANEHLLDIARSIRTELPIELVDRMRLAVKAFDDLWDPYTESYYPRDFVTHRLLKEQSIASLLPLYAGCISEDRAAVLVKTLESEHVFGPAYPIPSAPLNSIWFDPVRYWQGPTWFNTNWLIVQGLKRYGYHDHAAALIESMLEIAAEHGFYEYFNPLTGAGLGAPDFSWTAAVTLDLAQKGQK